MCVCERESSINPLDKVKYWDPSQPVILREGGGGVVAKDNKGEWKMKTCPTFLSPSNFSLQ